MPHTRTQLVYPDVVIPNGGLFGGERNHRGLDHSRTRALANNESTSFRPWAEGEIVQIRTKDEGIYGRYIEIVDDEGVFWSYCHAAEIAHGLRTGDRVVFSTHLGTMGSSGSVVAAGSEHLHTMCSRHRGSAVDMTVAVFDPLPHITARLEVRALLAVPLDPAPEEEDSAMFQYRKKSGSRWFVHPSLRVRRISLEEWAANDELGIRTVRKVDNTKAEVFRRAQNARAKQLDLDVFDVADAETPVEAVLDRFDLPEEIAGTVSDAVYSRVDEAGGSISEQLLEQIATEETIAAGGKPVL